MNEKQLIKGIPGDQLAYKKIIEEETDPVTFKVAEEEVRYLKNQK